MNYNYNVGQTKLYVGNLSYETTEDDLRRLFSMAGTVNQVAMIKDRDTGSFKGFAFITMNSEEEANKAVERFNGHSIGSRELKVNLARSGKDRSANRFDTNPMGGYGSLSPKRDGDRGY